MDDKLKLEDLGYCGFFETSGGTDGLPIARVTAQYKDAYRVRSSHGEYLAKITGKHMFEALSLEVTPLSAIG